MIEPGVTGVHFKAGDPQDLAHQAQAIFSDRTDAGKMRSHAREEYEREQLLLITFQEISEKKFSNQKFKSCNFSK